MLVNASKLFSAAPPWLWSAGPVYPYCQTQNSQAVCFSYMCLVAVPSVQAEELDGIGAVTY